MNGPFIASQTAAGLELPPELENLASVPLLLPGEQLEHYRTLRNAVFAELAPQSAIEWLLVNDITEVSWEIRRYHLLGQSLLIGYRRKAIEASLREIDFRTMEPGSHIIAERYTKENVLSWRCDPIARHAIEARLLAYGFDQNSINVETYMQARETLVFFEGLLNRAQVKRTLLLKEIRHYRCTHRATPA